MRRLISRGGDRFDTSQSIRGAALAQPDGAMSNSR